MVASTSRIKYVLITVLAVSLVAAVVTLAVYFGAKSSDNGPDVTTTAAPDTTQPTTTHAPLQGYPRPNMKGALVDYVYMEDDPPVYKWTIYNTVSVPDTNVTTYFLNVTSQRWMDETFSNHVVWLHNLAVHIPDDAHPTAGFVFITGGSNTNGETDIGNSEVQALLDFSRTTGISSAVLREIPNQPILFENDGVGRREDDLIAWTWKKYYDSIASSTQNSDMFARWPMVKGSVKAMDAMAELAYAERGIRISEYMVGGASKRGWTTWMTGAIDRRVVAMLPIVLSCLNMSSNFMHYWQSLGGWPASMYDYYMHGIMPLLTSKPNFDEVISFVDPYEYREGMDIPKLIISSSSDEFFLIDDSHYYFDGLPGEKHLWILENAGHGVDNPQILMEVWSHVQTFFLSVLQGKQRPTFVWERGTNSSGGFINVKTDSTPSKIMAWSAPSNTPVSGSQYRRDWRRSVLNGTSIVETHIVWTEKQVQELESNEYEVYYDNPAGQEFLAFFIKLYFPAFDGREYIYTTEAQIIPDVFPFPPCDNVDGCTGQLV